LGQLGNLTSAEETKLFSIGDVRVFSGINWFPNVADREKESKNNKEAVKDQQIWHSHE
jgi:hypothetical protein